MTAMNYLYLGTNEQCASYKKITTVSNAASRLTY